MISVSFQCKIDLRYIQVNLDLTDSMGPGKLVRHMQNPSYTYDEYLICIRLGPSISSVICKNLSYSGPSYPSSPVVPSHIYHAAGFNFPRGPGAYAPRFCCGPPRLFRLGAQNSMYINQKSCFWPYIFSKISFRAPGLKSKCQTLNACLHNCVHIPDNNAAAHLPLCVSM